MSNLSRDQFKATKVSDLKKLVETENAIVGSGGGNSREFLNIEDGLNKIRLAPKFPDEKDFYLLRMVHWASVENNKGEMKRIPILNAKTHGGMKKDIFEEYISLCTKMLKSPDQIKALTDWKGGISSNSSWWSYGWELKKDKAPKFGIFEFKRSVRDQLNSLTIIEDDEEAIEIDPFTDADEGRPILLTYNKNAKDNKDKYKIQLSKNAYPLTDEMFDELISQEPLSKIMRNVYGKESFEKALEGIRNYDIDNELDIFDTEEFQQIISELRSEIDATAGDHQPKKSDSKPKPSKAKVEEEDEEEEEAPKKSSTPKDKFSNLDREDLKEYIADNDLDIVVKKADSDEDIREKIRSFEAKQKPSKAKIVEEEEDEEDAEEAPFEEETKPEPAPKKKLSIDELKEQLRKKNGK